MFSAKKASSPHSSTNLGLVSGKSLLSAGPQQSYSVRTPHSVKSAIHFPSPPKTIKSPNGKIELQAHSVSFKNTISPRYLSSKDSIPGLKKSETKTTVENRRARLNFFFFERCLFYHSTYASVNSVRSLTTYLGA